MEALTSTVVLFTASAAALVVEIVAGRLLAPYVGMSLYTWTAIIAVVLAGLSAGHWLGGWLDPGQRRPARILLAWVFAGAGLTTAAAPVLLRLISDPLLSGAMSSLAGITLLTLGLFFAPSLFVGMVSPVLTRLSLDASPGRTSRVLGRMFAAGALGSIAGTLLAGFVFIAWLGSTATLLWVAGLHTVLAGMFFVSVRPRPATAVMVVLGVTATMVTLAQSADATGAFESPCTRESSYFCIRVLDYAAESSRPSRLMVLDHMGHGINDRDEPRWLHSSYVALSDRLVRWRGLDVHGPSAYFVGGGAFTLPRAWLTAFPRASIVVAEIDPEVTRAAHESFWLPASSRLTVIHEDARVALRGLPAEQRFDVIVGDAFRDLAIPAHLTSKEFAELVSERLNPEGIYLLTVIDDASAPRFLAASVRTIGTVFPSVEVWVDTSQFDARARSTFLVLASERASAGGRLRGSGPDDEADERRWQRLEPEALASAARNLNSPVLTDDHAPVDRLMFRTVERSR